MSRQGRLEESLKLIDTDYLCALANCGDVPGEKPNGISCFGFNVDLSSFSIIYIRALIDGSWKVISRQNIISPFSWKLGDSASGPGLYDQLVKLTAIYKLPMPVPTLPAARKLGWHRCSTITWPLDLNISMLVRVQNQGLCLLTSMRNRSGRVVFRHVMRVRYREYFICQNQMIKTAEGEEEQEEKARLLPREKVYLPDLDLSLRETVLLLNEDHSRFGLQQDLGPNLPIVTMPYKGFFITFFPRSGKYHIDCVGVAEEFIRDFESETLEVEEMDEEKQMDDDE